MKPIHLSLLLVTLVSVLIFINKGIDNIDNWRFYASLIGMLGMIGLCIFSYYLYIREKSS